MADNKIQFSIEVIDKASAKLRSIADTFVTLVKRIASATLSIVGAAAGAIGAVLKIAQKAAESVKQFDKFARQLDTTVEVMSQFRHVAERSGVSFDELARGLGTMQRRIGAAFNELQSGRVDETFERLNLSVKDLIKLRPEQQFLVLVDAINRLPTPAQRSAASFEVFGREAGSMLRVIRKGSEDIRAFASESDNLGRTISAEQAKKASEFIGSLKRLRQALRANAEELIVNVLPAFTDFVNLLSSKVPLAFAIVDEVLIKMRQRLVQFTSLLTTLVGVYASIASKLDVFDPANVARRRARTRQREREQPGLFQPGGLFGGPPLPEPTQEEQEAELRATSQLTFWEQIMVKMDNLTKRLQDQADAYDPLIRKAEEYRRTLKDTSDAGIHTPLEDEPPGVGSADVILEPIVVEGQRRTSRIVDMFDPIKEAAVQAARSIQQAFADFFFDPFEDGLRGLLKNFIDVIRRMIAEVLAFQAVSKLFKGDRGFTKVLNDIFGRASGGFIAAGQTVRVHEGELVTAGPAGAQVTSTAAQRAQAAAGMQFVTNIDARGADPSLISRLPAILDQRDRALMLKVKRFVETGTVAV